MDELLTPEVRELKTNIQPVIEEHVGPSSQRVDLECLWPRQTMDALAEVGLLGLHVPRDRGGLQQGLLALAVLTEQIGRVCPSSALCFGMHCVGSAVIAAKATPRQAEKFLHPIAEGKHVTTLALSESGNGVHFYLPETTLKGNGSDFIVNGTKQFITNGGHADSYVISTQSAEPSGQAGEFSCLVLERDRQGVTWLDEWKGMGMRGNSSRGARLEDVHVPRENLLGKEGDQIWYVFEVVAPYFLVAMAGTYVGIAQAALDFTMSHLRTRRHSASGQTLADIPLNQYKLAEMWTAVEKTRSLVYQAARRGDEGAQDALVSILASKADAGDTAVAVTNEAMTRCGGLAYRENGQLSRLMRDARASHVMAPTTDVLKEWAGKSLLGLPLL